MAFVLSKGAIALFLAISIASRVSFGSVYRVGDDAGWSLPTARGSINAWAKPIDFQVGDFVSFEYNPKYHNVLQVSHKDYKSCNTRRPIKSYATGNDSITLDSAGHRYYICGVPGHCQLGMKLKITIVSSTPNNPPPHLIITGYDLSSAGQLLATKLFIPLSVLALFLLLVFII